MYIEQKEEFIQGMIGIGKWCLNPLVGLYQLEQPTPETLKTLKPEYKVKPYHETPLGYVKAMMKIAPFWAIALLCESCYPTEQLIEESGASINSYFDHGDENPLNHLWIAKVALRDLIAQLSFCILW